MVSNNIYLYSDLKKSLNLKKSSEDNTKPKSNVSSNIANSNNANKFVNVNKIVNDEVNLVSVHMGVIKEDAALLTEEGDLVSNVKGVGEVDYEMDAYIKDLETIIQKKIKMYKKLKTKIDILRYNNQKFKKDINYQQNVEED